MIRKEPLQTLLRKRKRPTNISLQTILKVFPRLFQERLLARMLDTVYRQLQLQAFEALVCFDICERLLQRCFRSVARKGFENRVFVGGTNFGDDALDIFGASG